MLQRGLKIQSPSEMVDACLQLTPKRSHRHGAERGKREIALQTNNHEQSVRYWSPIIFFYYKTMNCKMCISEKCKTNVIWTRALSMLAKNDSYNK